MSNICIIGAGISGLATAWRLQQAGHHCTVLEASDCVGGAIHSIRTAGYLAEEGPNSIQLGSRAVEDFLISIPGLAAQMIEAQPAANKRYIVRAGQAHAVPMGPLAAITTPLWSLAAKLRVLREPFIPAIAPDTEESVADFVRRRLGEELYQYAINPLVGGIYAGQPACLSLRYGFPKLYALEQTHGSLIRGALAKMRAARRATEPRFRKRIISFKSGLDTLPRALADALGASVHSGASIQSIERAKPASHGPSHGMASDKALTELLITVPAHRLTALPFTDDSLRDALEALPTIDYPPVSVLSLGYPRAHVRHPLDGFGVLVPECEQRKILGVLFPSSVFAERAPDDAVLLTVFVGGERNPDIATDQTDTLLHRVLPELQALLGVDGAPSFVHHKHWPRAIPQYKLGYGTTLDALAAIEARHPGLQLAGNYRSGISLTYCLEAAIAAT